MKMEWDFSTAGMELKAELVCCAAGWRTEGLDKGLAHIY